MDECSDGIIVWLVGWLLDWLYIYHHDDDYGDGDGDDCNVISLHMFINCQNDKCIGSTHTLNDALNPPIKNQQYDYDVSQWRMIILLCYD